MLFLVIFMCIQLRTTSLSQAAIASPRHEDPPDTGGRKGGGLQRDLGQALSNEAGVDAESPQLTKSAKKAGAPLSCALNEKRQDSGEICERRLGFTSSDAGCT